MPESKSLTLIGSSGIWPPWHRNLDIDKDLDLDVDPDFLPEARISWIRLEQSKTKFTSTSITDP